MTLPKAPRIKIDFSDATGAKYSFAVEGGMSRDNMLRLMEFVDSLNANEHNSPVPQNPQPDYANIDTNFSRVYGLLQAKFKFGSFTSADVMEAYGDQYGMETSLSTISTYLSRLAERRLVSRTRNGSGWLYKLAKVEQETPLQASTMLTP